MNLFYFMKFFQDFISRFSFRLLRFSFLSLVTCHLSLATFPVHAGGQMQRMQQQRAMMQQQAQQQAYQQAVQQRQQQMQQMQQQAQQEQIRRQQQAYQQAVAQRQMQAAVQQRQMQMAVAQRQAQQIAYNQAVQQRRAGEVAAYQQAMLQKRAIEQRRQEVYNSQVNDYVNNVARRKAQIAQQQAMVMQQAATEREIAQHVVNQRVANQAAQVAVAQKRAVEVAQAKAQHQAQHAAAAYNKARVTNYVNEVQRQQMEEEYQEPSMTSIDDLWAALDQKAEPWKLIVDDEIKALTVAHYMDDFKKKGVRINRSPGYYAHKLDEMIGADASMHHVPFSNVLRIIMIMEYDFDNGQNKDELARKVLGDYYQQNKQRLGL